MVDEPQTAPRVFISYSWTDDAHTAWVVELGKRLMGHGVQVVLDRWDLQHGHDVTAFMERMVTDPEIKRVIVISDRAYAEKADGRRGGVGTETQIISAEVYKKVDQEKFIPIVKERDDKGNALLPTYFKNRWYIDFSDPDKEPAAYEELLRNIFERPVLTRPPLGKPPAELFDESPVQIVSALKARRFREVVESGIGRPLLAFDGFVNDFLVDLESLRCQFSMKIEETWCDIIRDNIAKSRGHRDVFVDVIRTGVTYLPSTEFMPALIRFLEQLLPFVRERDQQGMIFEFSEDNYKFLCYEFFLYVIAACIKSNKPAEARQLIQHTYVSPRKHGGSHLESYNCHEFNDYPRSLEDFCAKKAQRLSLVADLLKERATRTDIRFSDLFQADVVLCIATAGWYPRSAVFSNAVGKLELFLRAVTSDGFRPLGILTGLAKPQELLAVMESEPFQRMLSSERFWRSDFTLATLNYEELKRVWGSG